MSLDSYFNRRMKAEVEISPDRITIYLNHSTIRILGLPEPDPISTNANILIDAKRMQT